MGRTRKYQTEIGQVIGRWTILERVEGRIRCHVKCECSCGTTKIVRESSINCGESLSCGCLASERASENFTTHGLSKHPLYQTWYDMNRRCSRESRKDYGYYGGRGIEVCEAWKFPADIGFVNFLRDMGDAYLPDLELDRVDTEGNYEPSNCRWATRREQVINRRPTGSCFDTKYVTYKGETLCLSQWADKFNIPRKVLVDRLGKLGWDFEKAATEGLRVKKWYISVDGEDTSLRDFFKMKGLNFQYFSKYKGNHTLEDCCLKFLPKDFSYTIKGLYSGELIELYKFNRPEELNNDK